MFRCHPLAGAAATVCLACAATASQAASSLIGETLDFLRAYPDGTTQFGPSIPSTTVSAGTADAVRWNDQVWINPEADRVVMSVYRVTGFGGTDSVFDGFIFSGFDTDIASVTLLENGTTFTIGLAHDLRSFQLNLGTGSTPFSNGLIIIGVDLVDAVPPSVPEPATWGLLAGGLAVLGGLRRRSR